jgi:hypothetical protein
MPGINHSAGGMRFLTGSVMINPPRSSGVHATLFIMRG